MAIDVGSPCIDRNSSYATSTRVDGSNSANDTGTIDTVQVYAAVEMTGTEFASFIDEGSNVLSTNGNTDGSNITVTTGACRTFTSAGNDFTAFAVATGEYMGVYYAVGSLETSTDGGTGYWYVGGDNIPSASVTYNWATPRAISVYGTGTEAVGAVAPTAALYGPLVGSLGGPI